MKKEILFFLSFVMLTSLFVNGQVMYSDDFEAYSVGEGIASEAPDTWNTWSEQPGTAEDPTVSDEYAHSGTKSVNIQGTNDGVIEFNDLTSNRYRIEFYLYIPSGKQGYYNILQNFNPTGTGTIWGMQIFFQNGIGSIDGNGPAAKTFPYEPDTWIRMQHFVDLDNDWVDMYIDGELVHAYQWSHGTFNDQTGINKLDALNFFAYNEGGTCEYYMDDFIIEQVEIPNPPTSFAIEVVNDNDVSITWDIPEEGTPESYSVIRDGEEIAVVTEEFTYFDENLYPGNYTYQLKAYYGEGVGYSASAGNEIVNIVGGNQRQLVLFEIFTGTWCPHCPTAAQAVDLMANENLDVAIIEYHGLNGDPFETPATSTRTGYYIPFYDHGDGALGYPTTIINGMIGMEGALADGVAAQNELYDYYYEDYLDIPTVYTIDAEIEFIDESPYVFDINVNVEENMAYYEDEIRLFVALTETNIPYNWQGGLNEVNFVFREFLTNNNGTILDFSSQSVHSETFQLSVDETYILANCEIVIFVQNMNNAYIMEAKKMSLADYVGVETNQQTKISIYPNPANDNINIVANANITSIDILNITGQTIFKFKPNTNVTLINIENLSSGIYFINIKTDNAAFKERLIVE